MSFITPEELASHIRIENAQAISRGDEAKAPEAINAAMTEAQGYMSRYDYDTIFSMAGVDRNPILMMYIKEIAKWHFISVCNAGVDYKSAEDRYDKAIIWLKNLQAGKVVMRDWPLFQDGEEPSNSFTIRSNEKRGNHF